jgi:uncharacterized iron-regulated protein
MFRRRPGSFGKDRHRVGDRLLAICLAALAAGCISPNAAPGTAETAAWHSTLERDHELVGRIWDVRRQSFVERSELESALARARFVLLGEIHDNTDHHRLQAAMITALVAKGRRPAVVIEMIGRTRQEALEQAWRDDPDDPDAIASAVEWSESGWPPFESYRPIFEAGLAGDLPMLAAGLERSESKAVMEDAPGAISEEIIRRYRLDQPLAPEIHQAVLAEMIEGHCGHLPAEMAEPMLRVQRARDALLANALESGASEDGAILIAGNGHVRSDRAVPALLAGRGELIAVAFTEVQADLPEPGDYSTQYEVDALPFDYLWFTPRDNDIDHCAELMQQLESKAEGAGESTQP